MIKKLMTCSILAASISTISFAGNFYVGPSVFLQNISASHSSFRGMNPKVTLGYGDLSNNIYLAGEIFASAGNITFSDTHRNGNVSTKIMRSLGASFLPGMAFNDKMIGYLRLGIINSKFRGPNTTRMGGQLGFGIQTNIAPCWDLRGDYIYTAYRSASGIGSPKSNELGIGVIYKLDV